MLYTVHNNIILLNPKTMHGNGLENLTDVSLEAFMYRCIYFNKSVYIKYITVYRLIYKPLIIQNDVSPTIYSKTVA